MRNTLAHILFNVVHNSLEKHTRGRHVQAVYIQYPRVSPRNQGKRLLNVAFFQVQMFLLAMVNGELKATAIKIYTGWIFRNPDGPVV